MIKTIVKSKYGLNVLKYKKLSVGASSNTYIIYTDNGKYLLKNPFINEVNNTELEPKLCNYLHAKGIPVSEFVKNFDGGYICKDGEDIFHLQKFVEGINYDLNTAPDWLMSRSARLLGEIHTILEDYDPLPIGIGEDFFKYMTPKGAKETYKNTLKNAISNGDDMIVDDLNYRIALMDRFPIDTINLHEFTCKNTHGDYSISQLICGKDEINAIIDWTSACIHPIVWEIIRSFIYAEPTCINGEINIPKFILYIDEYCRYAKLTDDDIIMMPKLFFYQISVCDYYNQYYQSTADNRTIFLHQAFFSTKLMKWFDINMNDLNDNLLSYCTKRRKVNEIFS